MADKTDSEGVKGGPKTDWEFEPGKDDLFAVIPVWRMRDIPLQMRTFRQPMGTMKLDVFQDIGEAEKFSRAMDAENHIVRLVTVAVKHNPAPRISYFEKLNDRPVPTRKDDFFFFGRPEDTQRVPSVQASSSEETLGPRC